jgi:hypothetical protein
MEMSNVRIETVAIETGTTPLDGLLYLPASGDLRGGGEQLVGAAVATWIASHLSR